MIMWLILILVLFFAGSSVEGATVYTDPNCSTDSYVPATGACSGGSARARPTIGGGVAIMSAGDTLIVKAGTYSESGALISYPNNVTLRSEVPLGALWRSAFTNYTAGPHFSYGSSSGVTIDGFILDGNNATGQVVDGGSGSNNRLINSEIRNALLNGINGAPSQTLNNNIHDNGFCVQNPDCLKDITGAPSGYGIYAAHDALIENNTIHHNTGYGLHIFGSNINNNIFRYNTIHDNGTLDPAPAVLLGGQNNQFYRNTIYNQPGESIRIRYQFPSSIQIYNNTIYNVGYQTGSAAIYLTEGSNITIKNNIIANTTTAPVLVDGSVTGTVCTNNLSTSTISSPCTTSTVANPLFSNAAGHDFRLATGSPAIDAGTASIATGISIPVCPTGSPNCYAGTAPDLGAFEVTNPTPPLPSITITGPTSSPTLNVTSAALPTLSGTANANGGSGLVVTWDCDRCGSGTATGTTSWSQSGITLLAGINIITVRATTSAGTATDTLTVTYTPTFPGATLAGAWGFEEGSGTSTADSSANSNTANFVNSPTWTTQGKFGKAIIFNGTDQRLQVNDANSLDFTQSFSITAWVFPNQSLTGFTGVLVKPSDTGGYAYVLYAGSTICGTGSILGIFAANGTVGPEYRACRTQPLQDNRWTHLAITYDGPNAGSNLRLYVDGVLAITTTPVAGIIEPSTAALLIGGTQFGEYFPGTLDEIRVYNAAIPLTASSNTTPGATCAQSDYTTQVKANFAVASVVGDMNCPVSFTVAPPVVLKLPASATGLKIGPGASALKFGSKAP